MTLRERLDVLEEPELEAIDRIWVRYQTTLARGPRQRRQRWMAAGGLGLALAAAVALWVLAPETPRQLALSASVTPEATQWSEQIRLEALGTGTITGISRDATIEWTSGTIRVEVAPHTGTALTVVTEEARVEVVGTRFDVRRDALGSTVDVERGRVEVTCGDGWRADLLAGDVHTCLPLTAAGLLGRVAALDDAGADDEVGPTVERGLELAEGPVRGELLARRMQLRASTDDIDGALADARAYLASPSGRDREIQRFAGWLALEHKGCAAARPWLSALHDRGSVQDTVLLAECMAASEPERAREMLVQALPELEGRWRLRATNTIRRLTEVP